MNWDNIDWDNFNCVEMTRAIRNEMNAKYPTMDALFEHLINCRTEADAKNSDCVK